MVISRNLWWIRDPRNPILPPDADSEVECNRCMNPFALRIGDEYHLYYSGADAEGYQRICLATAPVHDPSDWTRHGVVLDRGVTGAFDHKWAVLPHVVRFADRWHLYYTGNSGRGEGLAQFPGIGLAFSDDGRTFRKYAGSPVIAPSGVEGDPDCCGIAGGSVVNVRLPDGDTEWRFYYTGCPTVGDDVFLNQQKTVCYAVSEDGVEWQKRGAVMLRDPDRDYVDVAAAGPVVWQEEDGSYRMALSNIGTRWGYYSIGCAESDDGIVWRRGEHYGDDLTLGPTGDGWERQMVEYPSVVRDGSRLRLFYCGNGYGESGIGTAVSGALRANTLKGQCALRVVAPEARASWTYRLPEGLSCDEGLFKSWYHPVVDWQGPTPDGVIWHEWGTSDEDLAILRDHEHVARFNHRFVQGIRYRVIVRHAEHGLELKCTIVSQSDTTFHNVVGVVCLGTPSERFLDPDLGRTYVVTNKGPTPLAKLDRGSGDPCRTHHLVEGSRPILHCPPTFWGELSRSQLVSGSVLRTSDDGRFTVGTNWEAVSEVWDNQDAHGCIHSNFSLGDLGPGQTRSVKGRVVLIEGGPEEALEYLTFQQRQ